MEACSACGQLPTHIPFVNHRRTETDLLRQYAPLVHRIAASLRRIRPPFLDQDDACQDGMMALLRAIRSGKERDDDMRFRSYLTTSVRGAIIDSYRRTSGISRQDYREARKVQQAIRQGLAVTPEQRDRARQIMVSAWAPYEPLEGEGAVPLASPHAGPEQRLMCNQLLRRAIQALQALPVRDSRIFIACELNGDRQADIAASYGISVGRVSQIVKKVRHDVIFAVG